MIRAALVVLALAIVLMYASPNALAQDVGQADDRAVLVALYTATDGPNWNDNRNWLTDADLNNWYGVRVDTNGRVSSLYLKGNGLTGNIPPEIGNLSGLETLNLQSNELTGPIPAELGNLPILSELHLGWNMLSEKIPEQLGELPALQTLDLSANQLTGQIPAELGNLSLLEDLHLRRNQLTGQIPRELGHLVNLRTLSMSDNQFSGNIPAELGNLRSLDSLSLYKNKITGEIPPELGQLSQLEALDLERNRLIGEIPVELTNLSRLDSLVLSHNRLSGEIPTMLSMLQNLDTLELNQNRLSGEIPPELGELTKLQRLWLGENRLSGAIPLELAKLTQLTTFSLYDNQLTGEIPPQLGSLTLLRFLNLAKNGLSGPIPPELAGLSVLESLDLYENELTGEIPPQLGSMSSLVVLHLANNMLSGEIPPELGGLTTIYVLDMRNNRLSGEIPPELGRLSKLETIDLSNNRLSGAIPPEFRGLRSVYHLRLAGNRLSGPLPVELGSLRAMRYLLLNNNQFSGEIPPELGNLFALEDLWLHDNMLSGNIPSELGSLSRLTKLHLNNNRLVGQMPPELATLAKLESLLVGGNQFTGCIPIRQGRIPINDLHVIGLPYCEEEEFALSCDTGWAISDPNNKPGLLADCQVLLAIRDTLSGTGFLNWWADVPMTAWDGITVGGNPERVTELALDDRGLTGTVPPELGLLSGLERLNLSVNRLTGPIPGQLGALSNLRDLELSDNNLTGSVPIELTSLPSLQRFFLSHNLLTGKIPPELGRLSTLRHLSLRDNQLTGHIPAELGSLNRLEWLDLANNGLTGGIPSELGMMSNVKHLALNDNDLSGEIPPELSNLSRLTALILSENRLSGMIFAEIGNLESLERLELHVNRLRGNIPDSLGSLPDLTILKLYENLFTGCLPMLLAVNPHLYSVHDGLPVCPRPVPVVQEGGTVSVESSQLFLQSEIDSFTPGTVRLADAVNGAALLDGTTIVFQHDGSETTQAGFNYIALVENETVTFEIRVDVTPVNDPPTAEEDRVSVVEGEFVLIPLSSLLINDTDPDGWNLVITSVGEAKDGKVSLMDDVILYDHDGSDRPVGSFTYALTDGMDYGTGLVLLDVTPVNDLPVAVDDTLQLDEGEHLRIDASVLLANDVDPDGDLLIVTKTDNGKNGQVTLEDGMLSYAHDGSETTMDSFTYTMTDGTELDTAVVTVIVRPVNDPPMAGNDAADMDEGGVLALEASSLLANDTDAEGDTLSVAAVGEVINGTVSLDGTTIIYAHDGSETTIGRFYYIVTDGADGSEATVTLSIRPVNDPPQAEVDEADIDEGATLFLEAATLLANDSDAEGDALEVVAVGQAVNGTAFLDDSTIVYAHDGSESPFGSFSYTISDGLDSSSGRVHLNVEPVNDSPVAMGDRLELEESGALSVASSVLLENDSDPDRDVLALTQIGQAMHGSVILEGDTVTYIHDGSETTADRFSYTVNDGIAEGLRRSRTRT